MSHTPAHLTNLETALAGLAPSASGLSRERLLYEAGKLAAPRRMRWPIAACLLAGLSAVLGWQLAVRPQPKTVEVVVYIPAAPPEPAVSSPAVAASGPQWGQAFHSSAGYLSLRDQVLLFGPDVLPAAPPSYAVPQGPTQDVNSLLRSI